MSILTHIELSTLRLLWYRQCCFGWFDLFNRFLSYFLYFELQKVLSSYHNRPEIKFVDGEVLNELLSLLSRQLAHVNILLGLQFRVENIEESKVDWVRQMLRYLGDSLV